MEPLPMHEGLGLIADDDPFFRMALRAILEDRLGLSEILEAGSLDEACEHLGDRPDIAIALFDLNMPGMNSPANLATLCKLFPTMRIAVVSASRRRRDIASALEAGVHGFIPKGVGMDKLADAVRIVLEGGVYVPPSLADIHCQAEQDGVADESGKAAGTDVLERLTPRQREVFKLLVRGMLDEEIMHFLGIGEGAMKIHMAALLRHLGARSRSAAAAVGSRLLGSP